MTSPPMLRVGDTYRWNMCSITTVIARMADESLRNLLPFSLSVIATNAAGAQRSNRSGSQMITGRIAALTELTYMVSWNS